MGRSANQRGRLDFKVSRQQRKSGLGFELADQTLFYFVIFLDTTALWWKLFVNIFVFLFFLRPAGKFLGGLKQDVACSRFCCLAVHRVGPQPLRLHAGPEGRRLVVPQADRNQHLRRKFRGPLVSHARRPPVSPAAGSSSRQRKTMTSSGDFLYRAFFKEWIWPNTAVTFTNNNN